MTSTTTNARKVRVAKKRAPSEFGHTIAKTISFGTKDRLSLYKRLERFTERNIDLAQSIAQIRQRYSASGDLRATVYGRIHSRMIDGGQTFAEATEEYLPAGERSLIAAGERASKISLGFKAAITAVTSVQRMKSVLFGALAYPVVLFLMGVAMLWGVAKFFLPMMLEMAEVETWPTVSKVLYHIGTFINSWGWLVAIVLAVGTIAAVASLPRWTGPGRTFCDRFLPPWSIYREFQASVFLISISAMVTTGRPFDEALTYLSELSPPWLKGHLRMIFIRLEKLGMRPAEAMDTGLLHREVAGDLKDYDAARAFDQVLHHIGEDSLEDGVSRIQRNALGVRVLMMLFVLGVILLTYVGMVFLVMDVAQAAKQAY